MNDASSAVRFQVDTLAWTQADGNDRYAKTDRLIVAPPIAEIEPGGIQIFRVMLRQPSEPREQAFRLIFEDITHVEAQPGIVTLRFNHNLPVFFNGSAKPKGLARLGPCVPHAAGCVRIDNGGGRYVVIESLTVEGKGWRKNLKASMRLLGGAWRQWTFKPPAAARGPITVKASTSSGQLSMELPPLAK